MEMSPTIPTAIRRMPRPPNGPAEVQQQGLEEWVQVGWLHRHVAASTGALAPIDLYDDAADAATYDAEPVYVRRMVAVGQIRKACPVCGHGHILMGDQREPIPDAFPCGHREYAPAVQVPAADSFRNRPFGGEPFG